MIAPAHRSAAAALSASVGLCALLAMLLVALFYGRALGFDLVWDDQVWVNEFRRHDLSTLLTANLTGSTLVSYYRPLVAALLTLQLAASQNPAYLHGLNIAVHLFNLLLVILLARRPAAAAADYRLPFAIAVLAIHPMLVEPVVWVSGRFDLIYTSFLLLSLLACLRIASPVRRNCAVVLAFFAALCSKEAALAYLAVGPLLVMMLAGGERRAVTRQAAWHGAALLIAAAMYFVLRIGCLDLPLVTTAALKAEPDGASGEHLALVLRTLGTYAQMTLLPLWNLAPMHATRMTPGAVYAYSALGLVALLLAAAGLRWPRLAPCTLWALALAPAANVLPFRLDLVQDRYLYFPIFAATLALLVAPPGRAMAARTARLSWLAFSLWLSALALTNLSIVPLWRDGVALFSWAAGVNPDSHYALENLALAQQSAGDFAQAIATEQRVAAGERSFQGRLLLARATRDLGDVAGSVALFKDALASVNYDDAMQVSAMFELALVYQLLGNLQASSAQAAMAETLAKRRGVSARLCEYYRRALAEGAAP